MQENNFETIISKWRRLAGVLVDSTTVLSMSGDSSDNQTFKKKQEETDLLVPETIKMPVAVAAVASDGLPPDIASTDNLDEKKELIKHDNEESNEAAGDHEKDDKDDYLENKDPPTNKTSDATLEKDKVGDKVDSVYLHPPPPHKARATATTEEEEDCGIKCLYYTLQCCDCVLM